MTAAMRCGEIHDTVPAAATRGTPGFRLLRSDRADPRSLHWLMTP
jgi:hypothetical protein